MTEMNGWPGPADPARELRRRAEKQVREKRVQLPESLHELTAEQARRLLHELRVHQIELEMQNEELRRSQAQLQSYWARYLDLYNQAPVGYLTLDKDGLILTANATATKMFTADNIPFIGQSMARFILPEDQDVFYLHRRQLEKGGAQNCELRILRAGASPFWARLDSTTGKLGEGLPLFRMTVTDISESKKIEKEKQELTEQLREKKQEMEDLLYITTHDLRSPMINIQGYSRNLLTDFNRIMQAVKPEASAEKVRADLNKIPWDRIPAALDFIDESLLKMDRLIGALLKVSRSGRVAIRPEILDMNKTVKSVIKTMHFQLEEAEAAVKPGELPPCKADPALVLQIFSNLLSNSLKYRDKTRKLEITVRGKKNDNGTVLYTVADNGLGIKRSDLNNIWQLFYSVAIPGVKKGEGIGLTMVRLMTERAGGRIWAKSKEGEGSEFFIELPA